MSNANVRRASLTASIFPETINQATDVALARYFDTPRPANDNRRTYRSVKSPAPYDNICSTRFKYVDVALPRVSILDGERRAA